MSIRVNVYKEISEYKEKILFGMSIRQLLCFSIAILLAVASYFICTYILGLSMDATSYIIIAEAIPIMAIGFIKINGINFEKYAGLYIRHKIGTHKLHYETELLIDKFAQDLEKDENERGSRYAWIFEKSQGDKTFKVKRNRKEKREEARLKEYRRKKEKS